MQCRISELQYKEVVDITDGTRYGFIGDLELDAHSGIIQNIVIAGKNRCLGLLGRKSDTVFPWSAIKRIGADIILVEGTAHSRCDTRFCSEKSQFFLKNR